MNTQQILVTRYTAYSFCNLLIALWLFIFSMIAFFLKMPISGFSLLALSAIPFLACRHYCGKIDDLAKFNGREI